MSIPRLTVIIGLVALAASAAPAADRASFGLGLGALYSGLGANVSLTAAEDLKFVSLGCSEISHSSVDGTKVTCGVGVGWLRSDIVTRKNSKHGLGLNLALDYDQLEKKLEPTLRIPYVYFFRGIASRGWNLGVAPLIRWDADGTEVGVMLEAGYQF